jgi:hypothetical protein
MKRANEIIPEKCRVTEAQENVLRRATGRPTLTHDFSAIKVE